MTSNHPDFLFIIIIIDNFCIAVFSGVHKLTAPYNILQHFVKLIEKIFERQHVHESNTYMTNNNVYIHKKHKVHVPYEKQQYTNRYTKQLLHTNPERKLRLAGRSGFCRLHQHSANQKKCAKADLPDDN